MYNIFYYLSAKLSLIYVGSLCSDCWHHLRNVWFGAVIDGLGQRLKAWMAEDLEEIHYSLRITLDVMDLLRAIEKYFGGNTNYEKGKGALLMNWM